MLITPHVIRSRGEAQVVTDELKSKLTAVRRELERIRRERERELQRQMPSPATVPPSEAPVPAPASEPVGPQMTVDPPASAPESAAKPTGEAAAGAGAHLADDLAGHVNGGGGNAEISQKTTSETALTETPLIGFMGLAKPNTTAVNQFSEKKTAPDSARSSRVWVVQVASHARAKDADSQARHLKQNGYDVQIVTAEIEGRTWYRVQVGQLATQREALELQKKLEESENLIHSWLVIR